MLCCDSELILDAPMLFSHLATCGLCVSYFVHKICIPQAKCYFNAAARHWSRQVGAMAPLWTFTRHK